MLPPDTFVRYPICKPCVIHAVYPAMWVRVVSVARNARTWTWKAPASIIRRVTLTAGMTATSMALLSKQTTVADGVSCETECAARCKQLGTSIRCVAPAGTVCWHESIKGRESLCR
jgi:hypothetical protein